jgi:MOSC domain-containing protein YiiM
VAAHLLSVNVGRVVDVPWGSLKRSGIDKRPVHGPVRVHRLGLDGDEIADTKHHGGPDQAVYAYAAEDLEDWSQVAGRSFRAGQFGENLTTRGLDVQHARLGERWAVGTTLLEVCDVRIPCSVFQGFVDEPRWVRRFTERGVVGAYLRVVREGVLSAGDEVRVVETRDHDLTVAATFRALTTERHRLPSFQAEPRVSAKIARQVDEVRNHRPGPAGVTAG